MKPFYIPAWFWSIRQAWHETQRTGRVKHVEKARLSVVSLLACFWIAVLAKLWEWLA